MFEFLKQKKTDPKTALKSVLREYDLPSFPSVATEVLRSLRGQNCSIPAVGKILSRDPGLSVQVLKMANTAAFSPARRIENLDQAIAFIGIGHVEALVMCVALRKTVPQPKIGSFNARLFWLVSAQRGNVAQALAAIACPAKQSGCFTAGFLQDMAIPFLAKCRPDDYRKVWQKEESGEASLAELERGVFGVDHAEVATWMCNEWHLPEALALEIGGHHAPHDPVYHCSAPVHLASLLRYHPENNGHEIFLQAAHGELGIPPEKLQLILERSNAQAEEFVATIGL